MSEIQNVGPDETLCKACGAVIKKVASMCPKCGVNTMSMDAAKYNLAQAYDVQGGIGRKWITVLLIAFFLGWLGIHRFYVKKIGTGILWLITLGIFGFGWLLDVIFILVGQFKDKQGNYIRRQPRSQDDKF